MPPLEAPAPAEDGDFGGEGDFVGDFAGGGDFPGVFAGGGDVLGDLEAMLG